MRIISGKYRERTVEVEKQFKIRTLTDNFEYELKDVPQSREKTKAMLKDF